MLRCASSFVIAAYDEVRLILQDSRALPAAFLRSRPISTTFKTFYEVDTIFISAFNGGVRAESIQAFLIKSLPSRPGWQALVVITLILVGFLHG
jgi:hypothetical protein